MNKIKLVIFTPTLLCGGSEKFVSLLCNHINTQLFAVSLIVLDNSTPFYKINNPAIEVVDLKQPQVRFSLFGFKKLVKEHQPDIIFSTANHLNLYFAIFRGFFSKSIKFVARESSIVSINNERAKMRHVYNWLTKKYYKRFDFIICQSIYMQQDLVSNYGISLDKTTIINNGIESTGIPDPTYPVERTGKIYKFITIGRLSEEKGTERLIHAVGLLNLDFQFYIIGDGSRSPFLKSLVLDLQLGDKIFFNDESITPFSGMENADLFLMGSYYEGFPNVLLEAGALGIPVIAFNVPGGITEIITDGFNGKLVDDNDIIGFAAAIRDGLLLNFNRQKISEDTVKQFSVKTMVTRVEHFMMQIR